MHKPQPPATLPKEAYYTAQCVREERRTQEVLSFLARRQQGRLPPRHERSSVGVDTAETKADG